jgi:hypothetical protein
LQGAVLFGCVQLPPPHTSFVQALPSSAHGKLLFVCTQPEAGSQESSVQGLPSSQLAALPAQVPPEHTSPVVQALPSSQPALLLSLWHSPLTQLSVVQALSSSQSPTVVHSQEVA